MITTEVPDGSARVCYYMVILIVYVITERETKDHIFTSDTDTVKGETHSN